MLLGKNSRSGGKREFSVCGRLLFVAPPGTPQLLLLLLGGDLLFFVDHNKRRWQEIQR